MYNTAMKTYLKITKILDEQVSTLVNEADSQINCKAGCSGCCSNRFKISSVEAGYLKTGFLTLPTNLQQQIKKQLQAPLNKAEHSNKHYDKCPLLIEEQCSLYHYRPLLCRAYGVRLKVGETISACSLNFNNNETKNNAGRFLEMDPFYNLADELSLANENKWQQKQTISEHLAALL